MQDAAEYLSLQIAFGPQGDGLHGFVSSSLGIVTTKDIRIVMNCSLKYLCHYFFLFYELTYKVTTTKWIPGIAFTAMANCFVIDHDTFCVIATRARAWASTFFTHTS